MGVALIFATPLIIDWSFIDEKKKIKRTGIDIFINSFIADNL